MSSEIGSVAPDGGPSPDATPSPDVTLSPDATASSGGAPLGRGGPAGTATVRRPSWWPDSPPTSDLGRGVVESGGRLLVMLVGVWWVALPGTVAYLCAAALVAIAPAAAPVGGWLPASLGVLDRRWRLLARGSGEAVGVIALVGLGGLGTAGLRDDHLLGGLVGGVLAPAVTLAAARLLSAPSQGDRTRTTLRRVVVAVPLVPAAVAATVWVIGNLDVVVFGVWSAVSCVMLLVAALALARTQYAWQLPERVDQVDLDDLASPATTFSLIVPARDEPVLARTLDHVLGSRYPRELVQLLLVVSTDEVDRETRAIAESYAARYPNVTVLAPKGSLRSKPISLEDAREACTGDLVGVLDAESLVASDLLGYVNTLASRRPEVGIFQGGVQLMNVRAAGWRRPPGSSLPRAVLGWLNSATSWWRVRNCLEYYVWFMSRLRYQAEVRFIPLGGNTVFVRREVLDDLGGWDVNCLTEDCDLGVRASVAGVTIEVFYHPALSTREETPASLSKLVVQRTRWMMGFVQVLRKRDWQRLPTLRQRVLAVEMLSMPFFQAFSGLVLPLSLALTFLLDAPVGLVILFYLPLGVTLMLALVEQVAFREFTHAYGLRSRLRDNARLVLLSPVYQFVLSVAAVRATARLVKGNLAWEKTSHLGAHHVGPARIAELEGAS